MKDLANLQQLFENSLFKIPDFQRGYSWENQHRADLLDDLDSIRKTHYTGTIVLKESDIIQGFGKNYTKYDIVDGQQRLTTILILINLISKELEDLNTVESNEIAVNLRKIYIEEKGPQGSIYKLDLDEDNDFYFKQSVINDFEGERKIKSHHRLFEAKDQFKNYLKQSSDENYLLFLNDLVTKLTQSLVFTLYRVENDAEVGIIFEVMNDRGKPLSQLEKVKNHLIYLSDRISLSEMDRIDITSLINHSWKEILENLSRAGKSRNDDENQFLRSHFIINFYNELKTYSVDSKNVSIGSQLADVHKLTKLHFKKYLECPEECYIEIKRYVNSLRSFSYKFRDLNIPYDKLAFQKIEKKDLKSKLKELSAQFGRLKIQSNIMVLLISIYEKFYTDSDKFLVLMELSEILAFRIYYIGEKRSYSAQNQIYNLSCDIYNERIDFENIKNILISLTNGYVKDDDIELHLTDKKRDFYSWKGIRYFLYEYERFRCLESTGKRPAFEWEELKNLKKEESIEHILPQTIRGENRTRVNYWAGRFNNEEHEEYVKKLGNLTLTTRNSNLSNKDFNKKKEIYNISSWQIERDIAEFLDWNRSMIDNREKELINFAKIRWGSPK